MQIPDEIIDNTYIAGAVAEGDELKTNGGRVIGCTAIEDNLQDAINEAYKLIERVKFDNKYYRKDIGKRALEA